jgi:hypothetical protein
VLERKSFVQLGEEINDTSAASRLEKILNKDHIGFRIAEKGRRHTDK